MGVYEYEEKVNISGLSNPNVAILLGLHNVSALLGVLCT